MYDLPQEYISQWQGTGRKSHCFSCLFFPISMPAVFRSASKTTSCQNINWGKHSLVICISGSSGKQSRRGTRGEKRTWKEIQGTVQLLCRSQEGSKLRVCATPPNRLALNIVELTATFHWVVIHKGFMCTPRPFPLSSPLDFYVLAKYRICRPVRRVL